MFLLAKLSYGTVSHSIALPQVERKNMQHVNKLWFYLFADDTNILYADKNVKALETTIQIELQKLYVWLTANKLMLNTKKSNFIVFHPYQKQLAYQPKICMFDNEQNRYVDLESKVYI